ncbi:hypothetical protein [Fibrella aquatica]|uniref:hypothetical protein n=1 Tax=Fibrella aquatica TaxID=3242487 RepID=UPI003522D9AD
MQKTHCGMQTGLPILSQPITTPMVGSRRFGGVGRLGNDNPNSQTMNTLQFNSAGLEEMNFAEMQETDGGLPVVPYHLTPLGKLSAFYHEVVHDYWEYFSKGFADSRHK